MLKREKLTSVKIDETLFQKFKVLCIESKFSLKKLVERSIFFYLTDKSYREKLHSQNNTKTLS